MLVSFDIKLIGHDQKLVGLVRQASLFLLCFWSRLIKLISQDTNMVYEIAYRDIACSMASGNCSMKLSALRKE